MKPPYAECFPRQKETAMPYRLSLSALALAAGLLAACAQLDLATPDTAGGLGRAATVPVQADDSYYRSASASVDARASGRVPGGARNIILFVGDGMGISTVTAARIHAGQVRGVDGESHRLAMDTLPFAALAKTYSHDAQVADSAPTATALLAGVKTRERTVGVTQRAEFDMCNTAAGNGTDTIFEIAERAGLATGIISTARLTHATPAAAFAETVNRDWESDAFVPESAAACMDIARQFIGWDAGDHFEIALGGGRANFLRAGDADPEGAQGLRRDENLAEAWAAKSPDHVSVFDRAGFEAALANPDARILGLFEPSHMQYELDRPADPAGEPSIEEMTRAAITRLSRDEDGYVLMVEGGRIDHAHHGANAARALADTVAFDEAVRAALDMTDPEDTLIIVTADHSHTFTIQGYPERNSPILGKVVRPDGAALLADDGKPYTTLSYANGPSACVPGAEAPCVREDLSETDTAAPDFRQQALVPLRSETHAGEDVPVFSRGPGSEFLTGVIEQNEIFHVMVRAAELAE